MVPEPFGRADAWRRRYFAQARTIVHVWPSVSRALGTRPDLSVAAAVRKTCTPHAASLRETAASRGVGSRSELTLPVGAARTTVGAQNGSLEPRRAGRRPGRHDARRGQGARAADGAGARARGGHLDYTAAGDAGPVYCRGEAAAHEETQRPKSARARYPSKTLREAPKTLRRKQQAFRATELREKAEDKRNKGNASPVKEEHDDVPVPPSEPPKDVVTRVVLWPEYALLRDGDVRVHVERHYREAPRGAQARRARPRWQLIAAAERARRRLSLRLDALRQDMARRSALGDARVHSRGDRRSSHRVRCAKLRLLPQSVEVEEPPPAPISSRLAQTKEKISRNTPALHNGRNAPKQVPMREVCGFSVQVAAHARGSLYMDTLHSTVRSHEKHWSGAAPS